MLEFDPATGLLAMPLWLAATLAVVIAVLAAFAIARAGAVRTVVALMALSALGYAGWFTWHLSAQPGLAGTSAGIDRTDERRLFETRTNELIGRAMLPGSPLACLDGTAGDQVAAGCEKLIFSGPDTIAAAVTYMTTRINMLGEGIELATASGLNYDRALNALRSGIENDRFGIDAYVLLQNPECKPENCNSLLMLRDPNKLRVNLLEKPFDVLVMRYSANWQTGRGDVRGGGVAVSAAPMPSGPVSASGGTPMSSKYDFPSASSIPPVSIMNAEPAAPPAKGEGKAIEAKADPEAKPAAAPKPAPKRAAAPKPAPARREAAAPTPLAPASAPPAPVSATPAQQQ